MHSRCLGLVLGASLFAGCGESHGCHLIGAVSGVRVTGGAAGASVRVCLGRACGMTRIDGANVAFLPLSSLPPGRPVELLVSYTAAGSPFASRVKVVPKKVQPNGPDCAPTVAVVGIVLDKQGRAEG